MTTQEDISVAQEILNQLGGRRFLAMTGSHSLSGGEYTLYMRLRRNKIGAQFLKIFLTPMDVYTMTFSKEFKGKYIVLKEVENVYNENLQEIFTNITGLNVRL